MDKLNKYQASFHRFSDFSFHHCVRLQAQRDPLRVHQLFARFDGDGVNEWFAIRHARGELDGWLGDLDIAWGLADQASPEEEVEDPPAIAIAFHLRYALIRATLPELVSKFTPQLIRRMIDAGHMTVTQALTWGRQGADGSSGFALLMEALSTAGLSPVAEEWLNAIEVGGTIPDADNRVLGLVRRISEIPPHLHPRLLALLEQEPNEGSRGGALRELAETPALSETTKHAAW